MRRPALGAPFDKRLTPEALALQLLDGPRAFDAARDVDLFDEVARVLGAQAAENARQIAASVGVLPTVAGFTYAPGRAVIDYPAATGPAWPLAISTRPELGGADGIPAPHMTAQTDAGGVTLTGYGLAQSGQPLGPLVAGDFVATVLEFQITAPGSATAFVTAFTQAGGTLDHPTSNPLLTLGRGYTRVGQASGFPSLTASPDSVGIYARAARDLVAGTLGFSDDPTFLLGLLTLGRWYRLEVQQRAPVAGYPLSGENAAVNIYDAATGETAASVNLYAPFSPKLGVHVRPGTYAAGYDLISGFTPGLATLTARRWVESRLSRR